MATTLQKWGNSLGVRLPKDIAERRGFREGSRVVVAERGGVIVIRPEPNARKKFSLDVLLSGITPDTLHQEVVWGALRGNEVWQRVVLYQSAVTWYGLIFLRNAGANKPNAARPWCSRRVHTIKKNASHACMPHHVAGERVSV